MSRSSTPVMGGGVAAASASLSAAIAQLEKTERELVEQRAGIDAHLNATREAITVMRKVAGMSMPPTSEASAAPAAATPRRSRAADVVSILKTGKGGAAAAAARERRILSLLIERPLTKRDVRVALPAAAGASSIQHDASVSNALNRLRVDGLVSRGDDGWTLTAKGRKAAAAAKEEP